MTSTSIRPDAASSLVDDVRAVRELPSPEARRAIRRGSRLSLAQLGRDIGVSSSAVWQWERAAKPLPITDNTIRYARLLADLQRVAQAA